jgi:c-di-GMP-binding flagellar brake protein YcgR
MQKEENETENDSDETERKSDFAEFNLQIGARLQILAGATRTNASYFTSLVGYAPGEFVLVKAPIERNLPIALQEGEDLTVRIFSGINVVSFTCHVERVFNNFYGCVQLSYPESVKAIRLRKAMRVRVNLAAQIKVAMPDAEPRAETGTLVNLSTAGGLIEAKTKLGDPEQQLDLSFTFVAPTGDQQVRVDVKATIRSTKTVNQPRGGGELFTYGVEFDEIDPSKQILLQNLLYEVVIANRLAVV